MNYRALLYLFACTSLILIPSASRADVPRGTFSIVAFDPLTHELGVAVQSKYFSVGTDVPWALADAGVVATQAQVVPAFGPRAIAMLKLGKSAAQVLSALAKSDPQWEFRQVAIVDAKGRAVSHTGKNCPNWAGSKTGIHYACQGNILAGPAVVADMARAFESSKGELAERLLDALDAAQAAGGDKRGMQSASLLIVRPSATNPEFRERYVDLRVDDNPSPIKELRRLLDIQTGFSGAAHHFLYARQYEAAGRKDLARKELDRIHEIMKRALARGEKNPDKLNGLAWECAVHNLYLEDALKAAERAVELAPQDANIIDTLAEVHFRMGHADKAVEFETVAIALDPSRKDLQASLKRFQSKKRR